MPKDSIWFDKNLTVEAFNKRNDGTLSSHLGIEYTLLGPDYVEATMPVDKRTRQPIGILNGGASAALIESLASSAGNFCVNPEEQFCVGLELNANHLKSAREGHVLARAQIVHKGRSTHVWSVELFQDTKRLCIGRMTLLVRDR